MHRIAVVTSGRDAPGMNAAIRAIVRTGIRNGLEVIGIERGYQGLLDGQFMSLSLQTVAGIINLGGTFLRTVQSEKIKTKSGIQNYDLVTIRGLGNYSVPGKPIVPFKTAKILIPCGEEVEDITVIPGEKVAFGEFYLQPGQKPVPIGCSEMKSIWSSKTGKANSIVPKTSKPFPSSLPPEKKSHWDLWRTSAWKKAPPKSIGLTPSGPLRSRSSRLWQLPWKPR